MVLNYSYRARRNRKRRIGIMGALIAINAFLIYTVTTQISLATAADIQVKNEQVVAPEVTEISDGVDAEGADTDEASAITIYTVKSGDTISGIAETFHIKTGTIYAANDLEKNATLKVGQTLVILPINGIQYTVKSGDTISGIATKFDVASKEILDFNDIDDPKSIKAGVELIIPDAEPLVVAPKVAAKTTSSTPKTQEPAVKKTEVVPVQNTVTAPVPTASSPDISSDTKDDASEKEDASDEEDHESGTVVENPSSTIGGFTNPAPGSVLTQGLHAVNAVDFGAKVGSPVLAAMKGTVIVAKGNGAYNGGFGNFIVISHENGVQTLYAHLSKVSVSVGETVHAGDQIGLMGNTGKSTGPHLHFEVHGAKNPWTKDKKYTQY